MITPVVGLGEGEVEVAEKVNVLEARMTFIIGDNTPESRPVDSAVTLHVAVVEATTL